MTDNRTNLEILESASKSLRERFQDSLEEHDVDTDLGGRMFLLKNINFFSSVFNTPDDALTFVRESRSAENRADYLASHVEREMAIQLLQNERVIDRSDALEILDAMTREELADLIIGTAKRDGMPITV